MVNKSQFVSIRYHDFSYGHRVVGHEGKCRHLCMESLGIAKQGSETITTAVRGSFMDNPSVKSEFLRYL